MAMSVPGFFVDCPFPPAHSGVTSLGSSFGHYLLFLTHSHGVGGSWIPYSLISRWLLDSLSVTPFVPVPVSDPVGFSPLAGPYGQNLKYRDIYWERQ